MHRIDTPTAQKDKFGAGKNGFTRGNPQTGVPVTDLDDDYFDSIQEEIAGVVEGSGLTLDKADNGQVLKALKLLFAANTDSMGALASLVGAANKLPYFTGPKAAALADFTAFAREILAQTDAAGVLSKLGLGNMKYGAPLIGQLIEWPLQQMPHEIWTDCGMEFIPYMAQSFDPVKYPLLSQLHPTNVLPADMRAQVARGWDNGRGVDTGRVLMSSQEDAIRNITGAWSPITGGNRTTDLSGAIEFDTATTYPKVSAGTTGSMQGYKLDASLVVPTAAENRMKNVAWNMIVRAK